MRRTWKQAVISALNRFAARHRSVQVGRVAFLNEELEKIVADTDSKGGTPSQTVSRILQELRDESFLFFSSAGLYTLNQIPIDASAEDFPEDVLENAVQTGNLQLKDVMASDELRQARVRKGMGALRKATLSNYGARCSLCDINDLKLLVTSHIARWADNPEARGLLTNTICFCSFHDRLFEHGYFALADDFRIMGRGKILSSSIRIWLDSCTTSFKIPQVAPSAFYLAQHRVRVGL